MDIEELNKSQIILLTLLVSFITSIATGIVTVSLMEQAPESVSRTITHVVERTVEQVKPGETQVAAVVKEVPVIVTEEELVLSAINNVSPAVAALWSVTGRDKTLGVSLGTVFMVRSDGLFVTSGGLVEKGKEYIVVLENEDRYLVGVIEKSSAGEVAILKVVDEAMVGFTAKTTSLKPVAFGEEKIVVGQSVIGVGASPGGNHNVSLGIISNLISQASSTATILSTNAVSADNIGGPLVDIRGKVVGLNLSIGRAIGRREVISTIDLIK